MFNILMITAKTGQLLKSGGLESQPIWYIEILGEFLIKYDFLNFVSKAEMVLGSEDKNKATKALATRKRGK